MPRAVLHGSHLILALECRERESRPAVRPRVDHAGHSDLERFTPRLTALGFYQSTREHQVGLVLAASRLIQRRSRPSYPSDAHVATLVEVETTDSAHGGRAGCRNAIARTVDQEMPSTSRIE